MTHFMGMDCVFSGEMRMERLKDMFRGKISKKSLVSLFLQENTSLRHLVLMSLRWTDSVRMMRSLIEYLSVSAPLDKVDRLEDKQSKYIHEYVKNKEYMIVGTERRHGFSQNDVDRQWHQIVDKIRKKQVDGVIVANMSVITDNLIDAFIKIAQVQDAGGIIVTVDDGRLAIQLRGF